jgi:membrane protein
MSNTIRRTPWSLLKATFQAWNADEAPKLGAALAFYSMLSIGPLVLIAIAVASMFIGHDAAGRMLLDEIQGLMGEDAARALHTVIDHDKGASRSLIATLIGLATLLVSATGFFYQLQAALNVIFNAPHAKAGVRAFLRRRILSFGMVAAICLLLLTSLVVSAALSGVSGALGDSLPVVLGQMINSIVSLLVSTLLFAFAFRYLPDVRLRWRDVWLGAGLTAILFTVGKGLIGLYLGHSSFTSSYGAAGSLIVLLVWVYYSAQIVFFGAEFTQVYARASGRALTLKADVTLAPPPPKPMQPQSPSVLMQVSVASVALFATATAFLRRRSSRGIAKTDAMHG